jgi:iron complex outermembrane receptor protein
MDIKNKIFIILLIFPVGGYAISAQTIPPVVVKKTKFAKSSSTKTGVTTIGEKQIKDSGAKTLVDVLKTVPTISVSQPNGQGGSVTLGMRGFGDNASSNTLILVDGQPLTNPDLAAPNLNLIPLSTVKKIKVTPLSEAVLYGDQAVGGVISIITKPSHESRHQIAVSYGSFNSAQGEMNLADKLSKHVSYKFFTQLLNTDNYRKHNNYHADVINGGLSYKKQHANAYVNINHADTNLLFPGALSGDDMHDDRRQAKNHIDFDDQHINEVTAGLGHDIAQNWQFKMNGRLNRMTGDGVMTKTFNKKRNIVQLHPAFIGVINAFNNSFVIHTGADFKHSRYVYSSQIYNADVKQTIGALYGQAKLPLTSKLSITTGARTARAKTTYNNHATIGSLMLTYQLTHKLQFYAQSAGNYRFPKTDEMAWAYKDKPLKTQTGVSYVLGSTWQSEKLNIDVNAYILDLKNEILAVPVPENSKVKNQNLPRTRHIGLNLNVNYLILPKWRLNSGYTYADAKLTAGQYHGNQIPFVAHNKFYLANYFYINKDWYLMLDGTYTGSRYAASDIENAGKRLNGFTVFNSAIGYHYHKVEIILRLNNLTNKKYSEYAVYSSVVKSNYYYPAPGINGMLNLKIDL